MKLKFYFFLLFLFFSFEGYSQVYKGYKLPKNPEAGKCYIRCFTYENPFEWKEIHCDSVKNKRKVVATKKDSIKFLQNKLKMKAYQKKLEGLGYNLSVTGFADTKTCIAHDKYLKDKAKTERKTARKARRKKKKQE